MRMATFDTHSTIKDLIGAGLPERTAEVLVQAIRNSKDSDLNNLASKEQVNHLASKEQVSLLEKDVENIMQHSATKADLAELKAELRTEIANAEKRLMIMIGGAAITICGFIFGALKYFIH